ncbi:DUF4224 domain-containing protein [Pseudomonas moraviensis]|uniref:Uncharacterized protein n=1 Tax=Pseudomonas moraviensis R28-S TaxID=1395516 RepID=V8R517_9PSED|nr:DUF4224 domain-containing protein [Pseudomonas moraviensis]ETF06650.1 hypothetical protein PMO01_20375 [Pseudomonas moraviensis R28-S]
MSNETPGALTFQDLQQITGYQRRSDVEKALISQGVRMFRGRCGPWTTLVLINHAGGIRAPNTERYDSDIL